MDIVPLPAERQRRILPMHSKPQMLCRQAGEGGDRAGPQDDGVQTLLQPQQVDNRIDEGCSSKGDQLGSDETGSAGDQSRAGKPQPRIRRSKRQLNPAAKAVLEHRLEVKKRPREPPHTPPAGSRRRCRPSPHKRARFDPYDRAKRTPRPPDMMLPKLNGTYSMDIDTQHGDKNMGNSQKG